MVDEDGRECERWRGKELNLFIHLVIYSLHCKRRRWSTSGVVHDCGGMRDGDKQGSVDKGQHESI